MLLTSLQSIRAWAAVAVLLFHLGGAIAAPQYFGVVLPSYLTSFGTHGVLLFFVLSGFIIHYVHASDIGCSPSLGRYLIRRAMRLYPAYWAVLALVVAFSLISGLGKEGIPLDPGVILKTLLLVPQDKAFVGGTGAPVIIVAWSLQYEMAFYALFAIGILDGRLGLATAAGLLGAILCLRFSGYTHIFPGYMSPVYFLFFFMGIVTSWAVKRSIFDGAALRIAKSAIVLIFLSWAAQSFSAVFTNGTVLLFDNQLMQVLLGGLAAILIGSLAASEIARARPASALSQYLGECSYVIYLVHFPVISAACKIVKAVGLTGSAGAAAASILSVGGTIAIAALLHEMVEKPANAVARSARFRKLTRQRT